MIPEYLKLLGNLLKRYEDVEKRVARLETLEFTSIFTGGGWVEIETITMPNSTTNIFTFDNIPQTFLHLALIICTRGAVGNEGIDYILCRVNNDADSRYWSIMEWIYMTAVTGCNQSCTAYFPTKSAFWYAYLQPNPGYEASNDPNTFCAAHMWIPNYRNQYIKKQFVLDFYTPKAAGEWLSVPTDREIIRGQSGGTYHEIDPITRLDFRTSGLRNFAKNSTISLYGIGGTFLEYA